MKKILSLLLCIVMLIPCLASCGGISPTDADKGAEIPIYLSNKITTLDPAFAYLDDAALDILPLLFEGLFVLDEDGEPENAMCKEYQTYTNRDGEFVCEFTLNDTRWSGDGRPVSANDFVFAWKRILAPDFDSPAAALLYDIKNARECKKGNLSIDDLGVVAAEATVLQVTFERKIDIEQFIAITASPALVPLREDKVTRLEDWGTSYVTMSTNGPFFVKLFTPGENSMTLERSIYYYRDITDEDENLNKYVEPYRLVIYFNTPQKGYEHFNSKSVVFNSNLELSGAKKDAAEEVLDTLSTHTYIFNTTKAPFDNANVRKALSLAIDRNEIAKKVTFGTAASGFIPAGVYDTAADTSFRENGGSLISASANMGEAKKLVDGAKITDKDITISVRKDDHVDKAVAEYIKGQWEKLGFKVTIEELGVVEYEHSLEYMQYADELKMAYSKQTYEFRQEPNSAGDMKDRLYKVDITEKDDEFDVLAVDSHMLSVYAFADLASFATGFSGSIDVEADYAAGTHVSGYNSSAYDDIIEKAFKETDVTKRSKLLHDAEKLLAADMPVMPIYVHQNAYAISDDLDDTEVNYYGTVLFTEAELDGYEKYKAVKK